MGLKKLTAQYNRMAATIEDARIYDGRGTYDLYVCSTCGRSVITTYKDKGVTPFVMHCTECSSGSMSHLKTFTKVEEGTPVLNWIRPTLKQFLKMAPGSQEHVLNGGLILERRKQ